MVFVHARNETVRTATILSELAKNNGESRLFEPDQSPRYGEALKEVRLYYTVFKTPSYFKEISNTEHFGGKIGFESLFV